ncbi:TIGR03620 family F420-dependent LLM class oxidoreductase [Pseudonocardia nematodicida]|uniref:TIGR03620 family F420-dependent LLM class oxidoreductase n=1 Tax=Pseudonocardia nematodicida TaxID=1206997 RepID=A0ABV1K9D8_9PSEU
MTTTTPLVPVGFATGTDPGEAAAAEAAGARALWLAGGALDRLDRIAGVLDATRDATVIPGIISAGVFPAIDVSALHRDLAVRHPGRFLVGLGAAQQPRAMAALGSYLDALDAAEPPLPPGERILAALGPRKLELARERFAGAVTLLVTPEHTAGARAVLGADRLLAVTLPVVLTTDAARARTAVRPMLEFLLGVPGYRDNARRLGFADDEISGIADRLVDGFVAWGTPDDVAARVAEHRAAGADHVALSVVGDDDVLPAGADAVGRLAGIA